MKFILDVKEITKPMSNGHANHIIFDSLFRIEAENLMSGKPNKQGPVISNCSVQQTNVTEGKGNQTETEKQGSVLNDPLIYSFKQLYNVGD